MALLIKLEYEVYCISRKNACYIFGNYWRLLTYDNTLNIFFLISGLFSVEVGTVKQKGTNYVKFFCRNLCEWAEIFGILNKQTISELGKHKKYPNINIIVFTELTFCYKNVPALKELVELPRS